MFLKLPSINLSNFIVLLPLLLESLSIMCIVIIYFPVCGVTNIEINLRFLIKPFSYMAEKVRTKIWICLQRKRLFRWHKCHFKSVLKSFQ